MEVNFQVSLQPLVSPACSTTHHCTVLMSTRFSRYRTSTSTRTFYKSYNSQEKFKGEGEGESDGK